MRATRLHPASPYGQQMSRLASLRPLGQLSSYGVAMGAVVGGGVAAALTIPYLLMAAQLGLIFLTIPAFFFGQAVGVVTGFLAPAIAAAAVSVVRPRTPDAWRATITVAVTLLGALPAGLLVAVVGLPLTFYSNHPLAAPITVIASVVVAPIAVWRLAPTVGRTPQEPSTGASTRLGWWLIALGLLPVVSALGVYLSAWMALNFSFDEQRVIPPVAASLVLLLAVIVSAAALLLAIGIALAWRGRAWEHGDLVLYWAAAALCAAVFAAIGFWSLVSESLP